MCHFHYLVPHPRLTISHDGQVGVSYATPAEVYAAETGNELLLCIQTLDVWQMHAAEDQVNNQFYDLTFRTASALSRAVRLLHSTDHVRCEPAHLQISFA